MTYTVYRQRTLRRVANLPLLYYNSHRGTIVEESERDRTLLSRRAVYIGKIAASIALHRASTFFRILRETPADPQYHASAISSVKGSHALYVHMPFCHRPLCRFCCFIRYPFDKAINEDYMKALMSESMWLASKADEAKIQSVYIGGGTPTIDIYALAELIDILRAHFGRNINVSVEASPLDINDESVHVLRSARVERLSIGIQALSNKRLHRLGRFNVTVETALQALEAARGQFKTLNIDIVWGIRNDTPRIIHSEARLAFRLGASQVTFYPLMPAPGLWRLFRRKREGPWHPMEPKLYETILRAAWDAGYQPATPWCMDKASALIDEYIVDYDRFLAVGVSAIGLIKGYMYVNAFTPKHYVRLVRERGHAATLAKRLTMEEDMLYHASFMIFGLNWDSRLLLRRYGSLARGLNVMVTTILKLLGEQRKETGNYILESPNSLYVAHTVQRSLYMAVNGLREWAMTVNT